jgi:hypothetical protein
MKLIKTTFGRHETFPLRYGWLTKGIEALQNNTTIFNEHEAAMIKLGLGRNMINALHYWLQAAGLAEFEEGIGTVTPIGNALLGKEGDPYLEDEATLWILHWLIASNAQMATGFYWFFNLYASPRFSDKDALNTLEYFVEQTLGIKRAHTTLKSDLYTLLRMYCPLAGNSGEEHLDSPLSSLQLITQEKSYGYNSARATRPTLPPIALHIALQHCFTNQIQQKEIQREIREETAIPLKDLLYGDVDKIAPGALFRLSEEGLMRVLQQLIENFPEHYALRDTAGMHQLYSLKAPQPTEALLINYYRVSAA